MLDIKIHNAAIKEKCRDESDMSCNQKTFEFLQKHYKEFIIKNEDGHFHWYNHSYALNIHILDTLKDGEFFIENQIGQGFGVIVNVNMEEEEERIKLEDTPKKRQGAGVTVEFRVDGFTERLYEFWSTFKQSVTKI